MDVSIERRALSEPNSKKSLGFGEYPLDSQYLPRHAIAKSISFDNHEAVSAFRVLDPVHQLFTTDDEV